MLITLSIRKCIEIMWMWCWLIVFIRLNLIILFPWNNSLYTSFQFHLSNVHSLSMKSELNLIDWNRRKLHLKFWNRLWLFVSHFELWIKQTSFSFNVHSSFSKRKEKVKEKVRWIIDFLLNYLWWWHVLQMIILFIDLFWWLSLFDCFINSMFDSNNSVILFSCFVSFSVFVSNVSLEINSHTIYRCCWCLFNEKVRMIRSN